MADSVRSPAVVSIAPLARRLDACTLCSTGREALGNAVLVRNASGATIEFLACERCAAAVRRLIATAGGAGVDGPAQLAFDGVRGPAPAAVDGTTYDSNATHDTVGTPVLIHEFAESFVAPDRVAYTVRVWGQARSDATWIGWLTFVPVGGSVLRTPRETSQSTREHLAYWATGLQPSYVEGAFSRAS